jgi:hypothetical protein
MVVRVVYGGGLENRWVNSPGGSNPSPSELFTRRDAREAEGNGLLNRRTVSVPRVRIPLSPKLLEIMKLFGKIRNFLKNKKTDTYFAAVSYFPFVGWVLPLSLKKENQWCLQNAKTGFMLSLFAIGIISLASVFKFILYGGFHIEGYTLVIIIYCLYSLYLIISLIGFIKALKNQIFYLPLISGLANKLEL